MLKFIKIYSDEVETVRQRERKIQLDGLRYGTTKLDIKVSKMYKIPDQVVLFMEKTMETCRVELTAGGKSLAEVKIQRGLFQGDALIE